MPAANGSDGSSSVGPARDLDRVELGADELGEHDELRQLDADGGEPCPVERAEPGLEDVAREPRAGRRVGVDALQRLRDVLGRGDVPQVVAERILGRCVVDAGRVAVVEDREHRERDRVGRQLVVGRRLVLVVRAASPIGDGAGHDGRDIGADQPVALEPAGVLGARVGGQARTR